jgi:hypothetical protein
VANGAVEACREYFQGGLGSLLVKPSLQNEDHINPSAPEYLPFTVGDVDTSGTFIHVMNEVTLDIAMKELDTVADLTQYLEKKSSFVRSGRLDH